MLLRAGGGGSQIKHAMIALGTLQHVPGGFINTEIAFDQIWEDPYGIVTAAALAAHTIPIPGSARYYRILANFHWKNTVAVGTIVQAFHKVDPGARFPQGTSGYALQAYNSGAFGQYGTMISGWIANTPGDLPKIMIEHSDAVNTLDLDAGQSFMDVQWY